MTNNFTNCSTKKRIIMMMKKQTSPWGLLKALYVLPVAFAAVAVISCTSPREKKADNRLSDITVSGDNPLLVFTFEDSTEVNIQGKRLNPDGNPDFDYLKVCGLTSENIDRIAALQSEEAEAIFGRSGVNGAIHFQVKGKTAKDMTSALAEYAQHIGSEEPLKINIKRPARIDEIQIVGYNSAPKAEEQGEIFQVVEEQPMFPGGMEEMMKFLQQNIKYPTEAQEQGKQGRVIVQFVVNKDGSISNDSVIRSVDPLLDAEALRVVRSMPNWIPGKQRGKEVRVRFTLPVSFRLSGGSTDKAQESAKVAQTENASSRDEIFQVVEEMPEYPGGISELMKYFSTNMRYPKEAQSKGIQGRVIVQFVVNTDGSITEAKVVKPVDPQLDAEALRVVNAMPNWTPGKQRGKAVRVRYTLPVMFHLK
ncbi:MAG: energy transducer TonB [Bacteroidaceae bacterium]|nr:energy transducer TonB [Bacteroidaceae bacterium]